MLWIAYGLDHNSVFTLQTFKKGIPEQGLQLLSAKNSNNGLVQLHCKMKKRNSTGDSILIHTQDKTNS